MNQFQVLKRLGEGAFSVVYKVKRLSDGKEYALKKVRKRVKVGSTREVIREREGECSE